MTTVNRDVILNSDIIVIAVKPHQVSDIMSEIQLAYSEFHTAHTAGSRHPITMPKNLGPVIVSVAAGVTLSDIEQKVCRVSTHCRQITRGIWEHASQKVYPGLILICCRI